MNEHIYANHQEHPRYRVDNKCEYCSIGFHCETLRHIHQDFCSENPKGNFSSKYWFSDQASHGLEECLKQKGEKPRCLDPSKSGKENIQSDSQNNKRKKRS